MNKISSRNTFDSFGNLKTVSLPHRKTVEYLYDARNRRVGKKLNGKLVQAFIYNGQTQVVAELDGQGRLLKRFIYGEMPSSPDVMIASGKSYRIISDQVGTPELIVDSDTGRVVESLDFDEFGIQRHNDQHSVLPFGFAGGLYDPDTGLVHFGARDYDPETGRWLSKDPIGFGGGDTNLYSYVVNDPVNFIDPSGKSWATVGGAVVGGVIGGIVGIPGGPLTIVSGAISGAVLFGGLVIIGEIIFFPPDANADVLPDHPICH